MNPIAIQDISQRDTRTLRILWTDGAETLHDVVDLRRQCPCAACIDEMTREKILKPEDVSDEVRPKRLYSVGRYALGIEFNDGHRSGIYAYERLRHWQGMPPLKY